MTVIELLDNLICDLTDYIGSYENDAKETFSRLEQYEKTIRAKELREWRNVLRQIREEHS
jgi:hypothetical protein